MNAFYTTDLYTGLISTFVMGPGNMMAVIPHNGSGTPNVPRPAAEQFFAMNAIPLDWDRIDYDNRVDQWSDEVVMPAPDPEPTIYILPEASHPIAKEFALVLATMEATPADVIAKAYDYADALILAGAEQ